MNNANKTFSNLENAVSRVSAMENAVSRVSAMENAVSRMSAMENAVNRMSEVYALPEFIERSQMAQKAMSSPTYQVLIRQQEILNQMSIPSVLMKEFQAASNLLLRRLKFL